MLGHVHSFGLALVFNVKCLCFYFWLILALLLITDWWIFIILTGLGVHPQFRVSPVHTDIHRSIEYSLN